MKNNLLKSGLLVALFLFNTGIFANCPIAQYLNYDKNNESYWGKDSDGIIWRTAPAVPFAEYPLLQLIDVDASNYGGPDTVSRIVCTYQTTKEPFVQIELLPPGYPDGQSYDIVDSGKWDIKRDHVMNSYKCIGANLSSQDCPFVES